MNLKILRMTLAFVVLCVYSSFLYVDLAQKPEPCVFTIRPIEAHAKIAVSLMQSGDTVRMVPDGKRHYWKDELVVPSGLSNVTFILTGIHWCVGCDEPQCNVILTQPMEYVLPQ